MANSNVDRQFEEALGAFLKAFFQTAVKLIKSIFRGIKKLTTLPAWIGFILAILVAGGGILLKENLFSMDVPAYVQWLLYCVMLGMPAIYLFCLGSFGNKSDADYEKMFKDIGFMGKDGKCPVFCGNVTDGKKQVLSFKSIIPVGNWRAAKGQLETALDCNILKIECGNSKKIVKLTVLPSDFKIPEKIVWNDTLCSEKNGILTIGQSALGNITFNLNRVPHVLVAGETGSGKSVILRCILWQMILQGSRVFMIDFKGGVEFGKQYEQFGEVIVDRNRALEVLTMLVKENEYRLSLFRDMEVKNLDEYNRKTRQNLCRIGVFSDEIAEMLDKKGVAKEQKGVYEALEGKLSTLARLSRATGINLFLGVQRPDANVLTGQIKNNIPVRISGRFADKTASEIVLGNTDAVELPDIKGRFLYKVGNETIEFQAFYFDDEEMLHDVSVETGSMLTEPETYRPQKYQNPMSSYKPEKAVKDKSVRRKKGFPKKTQVETGNINDSDAYPNWNMEEELPFPQAGTQDIETQPDWNMEEELPFPLDDETDYSDKELFDNLDFNF